MPLNNYLTAAPVLAAPESKPFDPNAFQSPSIDYARIDKAMSSPMFQQGQDLLKTDYLNSPETQQLLRNNSSQGDLLYNKLTSTAQALAGRRGLSGSSIEQFGVGQAGLNAGQATIDAQNQILLQASQRQQAARQLAAQALFGQAGANLSGEYGLANTGAQLTSDEVASMRNLFLGNKGIELGKENIAQAERDSKRSNNPLNLLIGGATTGATAAIAPF